MYFHCAKYSNLTPATFKLNMFEMSFFLVNLILEFPLVYKLEFLTPDLVSAEHIL